ncbi:MAG: phytanoyl-CoA dioxygenase family protein [Dongiaceae bacterium]
MFVDARVTANYELDYDRVKLAASGFLLYRSLLAVTEVEELRMALAAVTKGQRSHGNRNLLRNCAAVRAVVSSPKIQQLLEPVLGPNPYPTRAVLFDKLPDANWGVGWHQDLTVALAAQINAPGFSAWTTKDGVPHAQPPVQILEHMLFLRLHLDKSDAENGTLTVLPGSHRHGRLPETAIPALLSETAAVVCEAEAGDVLALRPLLLHMSRHSFRPSHRRVIQIEYSSVDLPAPLAWREDRIGTGFSTS